MALDPKLSSLPSRGGTVDTLYGGVFLVGFLRLDLGVRKAGLALDGPGFDGLGSGGPGPSPKPESTELPVILLAFCFWTIGRGAPYSNHHPLASC